MPARGKAAAARAAAAPVAGQGRASPRTQAVRVTKRTSPRTKPSAKKVSEAAADGSQAGAAAQADEATPRSQTPPRSAKLKARRSLLGNSQTRKSLREELENPSSSDEDWVPDESMNAEDDDDDSDFEMSQTPVSLADRKRLQEQKRQAETKAARKRKAATKRAKAKKREEDLSELFGEDSDHAEGAGAAGAAAADDGDGTPIQAKKKRRKGKAAKKKETAAERVKRLHPEIQDVWESLSATVEAKAGKPPPSVEQPQGLKLKLLPFQREGLAWMCNQETESAFQGGILSDEMGMGKTIQTIALMLARPSADKPTLVVAPTVAIMQWKSEIDKHTEEGLLKAFVYHGSTRDKNPDSLRAFNVILTSFSTVESEFRRSTTGFTRKGKKMTEPSALQSIDWHRIVLDEAHHIKDRSSSTARAAFALTGDYRWSLSGTPLQNRVGELYSLVKFLKADPYSFYFCKQCDCKSLTWQFKNSRFCSCCGHKSYSHFCWWNREILRPIQKHGPQGEGLEAFNKLRKLLQCMMLRRTKVERGSELGLPPRIVYTRRDLFSEEEEDFYEALYSESRTKFVHYVQEGTVLNHYAHIFELLMRMRQAVNHPWLVTLKGANAKEVDVCGICHEEAEDPVMSSCNHVFCREDIRLYLSSCSAAADCCPVCYRPITVDLTQPTLVSKRPACEKKKKRESIVRRLDMEAWRSSTKIEALLEELTILKAEDKTIKSIVFSQFTRFLDLLDWRLQRAGIRCVKLDGRMSPAQRAKVIEAFNQNRHITVFLISLKAGGVALNLTAASRVFLTDPWWNPAVEVQAMDRIHRLGQFRPVIVKRLLVENSIESRINQLQEKKNLLFQSTVGQDQGALTRLTEDDLKFLFVL